MAKYSLDEDNKRVYRQRSLEWEEQCVTDKNNVENLSTYDTIEEKLTSQLDFLSDEEKETITEYTGFLAQELNNALATGKILSSRLQRKKEILESALSKGIIPEDVTVIRKTIPEYLGVFPKGYKYSALDMNRLVGREITNKAFTSTSLVDFPYPGRNVIMRLHIPKGYQGALYIKKLAREKYKHQEEILFTTGMKYRVLSVELKDGIYYMEVVVT